MINGSICFLYDYNLVATSLITVLCSQLLVCTYVHVLVCSASSKDTFGDDVHCFWGLLLPTILTLLYVSCRDHRLIYICNICMYIIYVYIYI